MSSNSISDWWAGVKAYTLGYELDNANSEYWKYGWRAAKDGKVKEIHYGN